MNQKVKYYPRSADQIVSIFKETMPKKTTRETRGLEDFLYFFEDHAGYAGNDIIYARINICYNDWCETTKKVKFRELRLDELHSTITKRLGRYFNRNYIPYVLFPELGPQTYRYHMHGIAMFKSKASVHDYHVFLRKSLQVTEHFIRNESVKICDSPADAFGYMSKDFGEINATPVYGARLFEIKRPLKASWDEASKAIAK